MAGALYDFNATQSPQTVTTSAALLLGVLPEVGIHDVTVVNRGNSTIYIKLVPALEDATANDGHNFWHPITSGECASFRTLPGDSRSNLFAKADSSNTAVYARRSQAKEYL